MEFINIGPVYIRWWVGGVAKAIKTKKQDDTLVEFRVAMMSTCTQKKLIFYYEAWTGGAR